MKRNAFGQPIGPAFAPTYHRPFLRYFAPDADEGKGGGGGDEFKAPASQEELDKIVNDRLARERKKFDGHDDFKAKAEKWDAHEKELAGKGDKEKPKPSDKKDEQPAGLSDAEVKKRIDDALAADRLELALDRVNDALDKALEGRTFAASKLITLDRKQFIAADGKSVDKVALDDWVKEHTAEAEKPEPSKRKPIPGQGDRGDTAPGLDSGRAAYEKRHPKKDK